ncbi:hypothetical protein [Caulobacter segnis]
MKIIVDSVDGEVLDVQAWGTTQISSSGGGGRLHDGTGYISAPTITSRSGEHCQVLFRTTAGDEREVDLNGGVGFREGSRIRVVYVKPETVGSWVIVSVTNLDTGAYAEDPNPVAQTLLTFFPQKTADQIKKEGQGAIVASWVFGLMWVIALVSVILLPRVNASLLPIPVMIVYGFWRGAALKRQTRRIEETWQRRAVAIRTAIASARTNGGSTTFEA